MTGQRSDGVLTCALNVSHSSLHAARSAGEGTLPYLHQRCSRAATKAGGETGVVTPSATVLGLEGGTNNCRHRLWCDTALLTVVRLEHAASILVPLLALQAMQHLAMFSAVTMLASLMMCSHDGRLRRISLPGTNSTPQ